MQEIKINNIIIRIFGVAFAIFLVINLYKNDENIHSAYSDQEFKFPMISTKLSKEVSVSNLSDESYIATYFASWCGACKDNLKSLSYIKEKTGLKIFGIDLISPRDNENAKLLYKNFFDDILLDSKGNSIKTFAISAIPVTILVGKSGKILFYHVGSIKGKILEEIIYRVENDRGKK